MQVKRYKRPFHGKRRRFRCLLHHRTGKVDGLLQSSPKERRIIFDEAAGISRFKVKKLESLRRLERVDQNVERLKDILEEVERQLKTVRLQATKAQKWQEYSDRLKELRLNLGLQEYSQLTENLEAEYTKLSSLKNDLEQGLSQTDELEKKPGRKNLWLPNWMNKYELENC